MDVFFENAQRIFDVARSADSSEPNDFALLVNADGGLHFLMESALDDSHYEPLRTTYRVTRTVNGCVRVTGRNGGRQCILEQNAGLPTPASELLRDQPRYWISSPVTTSAGG